MRLLRAHRVMRAAEKLEFELELAQREAETDKERETLQATRGIVSREVTVRASRLVEGRWAVPQ